MRVYDKSKIGKLMALGGEHLVYEYGTGEVIKFSLLFYLLGHRALKKAASDIERCEKFFGNYFLHTDIAVSLNGKYVVHIQKKISGRGLRLEDLKDVDARRQFDDIMRGYRSLLEQDHAEIDLIGREGFLHTCFSNIFVTPDKKLLIIDGTLWDVEGYIRPFVMLFRRLAMWKQNKNLKAFTS